jgi:4-amino-4-deoxy-L-arabinose transferase-like glycosyltransferase
MAASISMLGLSEFSVLLPNLLALLAIVAMLWLSVCRWSGILGSAATLVMLLSAPIIVLSASTITPDLVELALVVGSVLLLLRAAEAAHRQQIILLVAAGAVLGLAFSVRETSVALVAAYGALFLVGYGVRRERYLLLVAGFAAVWIVETGLTWAASGDPWYRYRIDIEQHHPWQQIRDYDFLHPSVSVASGSEQSAQVAGEVSSPEVPDVPTPPRLSSEESRGSNAIERMARRIWRGPSTGKPVGPIDVGPAWNPYVALVSNHEYGVLFLLFGVALVGAVASANVRRRIPRQVWVFVLLGICWFVVQTYVVSLRQHPRYYLPTVVGAAMLSGAWVTALWRIGRRRIAGAATALALVVAVLAYDLQTDPLRPEAILATAAERMKEPIGAPDEVARGSRFFLQTGGVEKYVVEADAKREGLVFVVGAEGESSTPGLGDTSGHMELVAEWPARPRVLGLLLKPVGVLDYLPASVREKVYLPDAPVALYRVNNVDEPTRGRSQDESDDSGSEE